MVIRNEFFASYGNANTAYTGRYANLHHTWGIRLTTGAHEKLKHVSSCVYFFMGSCLLPLASFLYCCFVWKKPGVYKTYNPWPLFFQYSMFCMEKAKGIMSYIVRKSGLFHTKSVRKGAIQRFYFTRCIWLWFIRSSKTTLLY